MARIKSIILMASMVVVAVLQSCNNDYDDSNYYHYYNTIGSLNKSENSEYYINSDKGNKLLVTNPDKLQDDNLQVGDRIYSEFGFNEKFEENNAISIFYAYKVLVKDPIHITTENSDDIADNNISASNIWTSKDYLNFIFQFYGDGSRTHYVNLVTVDDPKKSEDGYLYVELRHNNMGDPGSTVYNGIVSFKTDKLIADNPGIKGFIVRVKTFFHGEEFYKVNINADNTSDGKQQLQSDATLKNNIVG